MSSLGDRVEQLPAVRFWKRFTAASPGVLAAAVAYNLFFALVPMVAVLLIIASLIGRDVVATERSLTVILPEGVARSLAGLLQSVADLLPANRGAVIAVSLVVAGWSASRGVLTIIRVLASIEGFDEDRSWWEVRLIAIGLTVVGGVVFLLTLILIPIGGVIAERLEETTGITWIHVLWNAARIPLASLGMLGFLWLFYRYGPPRRLPGTFSAALAATTGIVLFSLAFQAYLDRAGALGSTVAVFGSVALLLLWLYVIAYVIIMAAAVSAALARRWAGRRTAQPSDDDTPRAEQAGDVEVQQ